MERLGSKKGRQYFDTGARPSHVTFDDGWQRKRNFPWAHYVEARWDYEEPETIHVTIGNWLVVIVGHNVAPLYAAIEEHTLTRVCAHPEYDRSPTHDDDTFATEIRFTKPPSKNFVRQPGQIDFDLLG